MTSDEPTTGPEAGLPTPEELEARRAGARDRAVRLYRVRVLMLGLVVACVWLGMLGDPGMRALAASTAWAVGLALAGLAVVLGLGWLGFGLFAAGDRLRGAGRWPESESDADRFAWIDEARADDERRSREGRA